MQQSIIIQAHWNNLYKVKVILRKTVKSYTGNMSEDSSRVVLLWFYSLDLWSDVMYLHAVLCSHHHVVCGSCVCSQDHTILMDKYRKYSSFVEQPVGVMSRVYSLLYITLHYYNCQIYYRHMPTRKLSSYLPCTDIDLKFTSRYVLKYVKCSVWC